MFEDLLRGLVPPPQGRAGGLSALLGAPATSTGWGQLQDQFGPEVAGLPKAPAGDFMIAGNKLQPMQNGRSSGDPIDVPRGPALDVSPLAVQQAPAQKGGGTNLGDMIAGLVPQQSQQPAARPATQTQQPPPFEPHFIDGGLPGNMNPLWVKDPAEEMMGRQAAAFNMARSQVMGAGHPWDPNSGPTPAESALIRELTGQIGGAAGMASDQSFKGGQLGLDRSNRMDVQRLDNQGRMDVANVASSADQFRTLDMLEQKIREDFKKGVSTQPEAQAQIDNINARRQGLAGGRGIAGAGLPGAGGPAPAGAGNPLVSPGIGGGGGADIDAMRNSFGTVDPQTGAFTPDFGRIGSFAAGLKPEQIPQIAAAIKGGQFGQNKSALIDAIYQHTGRQYQLATGAGKNATSNPMDEGKYLIGVPYNGKQLFQIGRVPNDTAAGRLFRGAGEAATGTNMNKVVLPDGRMIDLGADFNPGGLMKGQSNLSEAQRQLPYLAELISQLQGGGPQPQRK